MNRWIIIIPLALFASCTENNPERATNQNHTSSEACVADLSADKSKYFETAQKVGVNFAKLSKLPFSAGLENQVKSVVANSFQEIPEYSVRCAIVAKLQACAINAGNHQLAAGMQETVLKTCAGNTTEGELKSATYTADPSSRHNKWVCVPPGRRGAGTDLVNEDPNREQLSAAVLFWAAQGDSEALRCAQILLKSGADPNYTDPDPTYMPETYFPGPPLHLAISQKRWDMADILLKNGADPDRRSLWGQQTAIEVAKAWGGAPTSIMAIMENSRKQ